MNKPEPILSGNTGLYLLDLKELQALATRSDDYSEMDLAVAWELFDRLLDGRLPLED